MAAICWQSLSKAAARGGHDEHGGHNGHGEELIRLSLHYVPDVHCVHQVQNSVSR